MKKNKIWLKKKERGKKKKHYKVRKLLNISPQISISFFTELPSLYNEPPAYTDVRSPVDAQG